MNEIIINPFDFFGRKQEVNFDTITNNDTLDSAIIRNLRVDNDFIARINSCGNLKQIWYIDCIFDTTILPKNIEVLKLEHCDIEKANIFNQNIKRLYLINSSKIDINSIVYLNLITLKIVNVNVENLNKINNFINLEYLYLQEIKLSDTINYNQLTKLKVINFDGSKVYDKQQFLKQFENRNIKVSFLDNNLKIG